ncbi:alpha/beta hydrolase fold domain-containing protein [Chryseobacterium formosus]|uniref:Alpha/beta hydrolase fold domain-containing protein n=1 Tax=Chryseobacterium formosus TaxID=1537363 RepID=A0ABT3XN04_9FLAO|nr:alpha/beta hydrolase fold domain-containing protein [Chryseobacterium formosus]MCX8522857.1 alpha/beta hydrolase fold domain-containing protein [Chryseobacterium formosus]
MKLKISFLFIILSQFFISQQGKIINNQSTAFEISNKNEKIEFMVVDTELKDKKPIFLWCQGSLPYPLYVNSKEEGIWMIGGGISNFDISTIVKYYHLVVIAMPETPLIADEKDINESYWYFGNSKNKNEPTIEFQKADYLENYVNRAQKVLKFLNKQKWVDHSKLIVAGSSQGSKVATKIAIANKNVSKLGLFSANPFGRIDQMIRDYRKDAEQNRISWEKADKEIEKEYQTLRDAYNPKKVEENPNLLAWKSFSVPLLDDWLNFNKPIYIAYGTHDIASDLNDIVPLFFIRENKNNLTLKRYLNLEHNFFEVENGKTNHDKPHWEEVMDDFVKWTLK